jgi:hypothetical protein
MEVVEHKSSSYAPRTYHNACSADVTIAIAIDYSTAGEKLTKKAAGDKFLKLDITEKEPIELARILYLHMKRNNCKTINIAGNGIYTWANNGFDQKRVNEIVFSILNYVAPHISIEKIVCGGQTGTDIAGAIAAQKLGIPCIVTMPKGFRMRWEDGVDKIHSKSFVISYIDKMCETLDK